jgi:hypothetical protein
LQVDDLDEISENEVELRFDGIEKKWFDERITPNSMLR